MFSEERRVLGNKAYGTDSETLAFEAISGLRARKLMVSAAESCTGGMLLEKLTSVPNASQVVEIGITAYSDRIKREALSIPAKVINEHGAVSWQTAMYLAKNIRIISDSDIGIGITGNAGPAPSEDKPVGLVFVAIANKYAYYVEKLELCDSFSREQIREYATLTALYLIKKYAQSENLVLPGMVNFGEEFVFEDKEETASSEPEELCKPSAEEQAETSHIIKQETTARLDVNAAFARVISTLKSKIQSSKKPTKKELIIKITSIIASLCLIISSSVLVYHFVDENNQRGIITGAAEEFDFESTEKNNAEYVSFDELKELNPDIMGWISISNTNVNNPIYQTFDNDFYLNHNMLGDRSRYGALFFDYNNIITSTANSKNLTIYGHNMKDRTMFGSLERYRDINFYKQNPIICLKTLYDQADYVIFSVMVTNASASDDNGYVYNYTLSSFPSESSFLSWINESRERSLIKTNIEIGTDDEILTLSTCCYDFDDARFVIMAKRLNFDEDAPDVSGSVLNANVRYPQAWYDAKGLAGYTVSSSESSSQAISSEEAVTDDVYSQAESSGEVSSLSPENEQGSIPE